MNTQTLTQRRAIHAYNEARREAMFAAERHRVMGMTAMPTAGDLLDRIRQPEPVQMCAVVEDSDPPLLMMLAWIAIAIPAWVLFGWAVVTVLRLVGGAA